MKCQVVLKSGPRAGRKCLRVNCAYHSERKEEERVEVKEVVFSDVEVQHPIVGLDDTPPPLEPIPVEESSIFPPVEDASPQEEKIVLEMVRPEEQLFRDPVVEEFLETVVEKPGISEKEVVDVDSLGDIQVAVKEEFLETIVEKPKISEKEVVDVDSLGDIPVVVKEEKPKILEKREIVDVEALGEIQVVVKEEEFVEVTENDCKERTEVMVIDTETIGLPPHKSVAMSSAEWERCRVVQIAWKLLSSGVSRNYIIRPDDFKVQLTGIHGITQEQAEKEGVPMRQVLKQLCEDLKTVAVVVAHNIEFDHQVIAYEMYRAGVVCEWESDVIKKECTMQLARVAGISEKPPRLGVLYETCFGRPPVNKLHRADADVEVCAEIYEWLKEKMQYKVYFQVDYKDKEVFKFFGGQWDPEKKKWYTYECHRFFSYLKKWFSR